MIIMMTMIKEYTDRVDENEKEKNRGGKHNRGDARVYLAYKVQKKIIHLALVAAVATGNPRPAQMVDGLDGA